MSKKVVSKKKTKKVIPLGIVNLFSSYNNTIINLSDEKGNTIAWQSAGTIGYKGTKKSTPFASKLAAEAIIKTIEEVKMKKIIIKTKGFGPGRNSAIKSFKGVEDLDSNDLKDITPLPHNGCRLSKKERKK